MIEKLDLNIQVTPRYYHDGRVELQAYCNGKKMWENKCLYRPVEIFYATLKPIITAESKIGLIKAIRKQTEELLAILAVQEAALQGTVKEEPPF